MRLFLVLLAGCALGFLQYHLWMGATGIPAMLHLKKQLAVEQLTNEKLKARNAALLMQVKQLQQNKDVVETHAREDFGMVRSGETFYQAAHS